MADKKILGHTQLTDQQIDNINIIKQKAKELLILIENTQEDPNTDLRFSSLAITNVQTGCMWAVRAIASPGSLV